MNLQMAVAISISMVFVVVNPVYDALDQRSYWTVVTTGMPCPILQTLQLTRQCLDARAALTAACCIAAFVLEPTLGSALNKGAQGMLGAFIGAALGIGSQAIAGELVGDYNYNRESAPLVSSRASVCLHGFSSVKSGPPGVAYKTHCATCRLRMLCLDIQQHHCFLSEAGAAVQAVASTACIAVVTFFLMLHRLRYAEYSHLWHVSIYTVAIVAVPGTSSGISQLSSEFIA